MVDEDGRDGAAHQSFYVVGARWQHDLEAGGVPKHGLRTVAVLTGTAAAQAVQHVVDDRNSLRTARHITCDGRLVDERRPCDEAEGRSADVDKGPRPRHG